MKKTVKIDITIIMFVSLISANLYIALEGIIFILSSGGLETC